MKHKNYLVLLAPVLFVGCVSAKKYKDLEGQYGETQKSLTDSQGKVVELQTENQILQNKLGASSVDRNKLQSNIDEMKKAMSEMNARKKETEKRMKEYQDLVSKFRGLIDTGKLSVKIVDGRMVVVLGSDILFPSGSAQLSDEGIKSIREITSVLIQISDQTSRKFQIEGHTDNIPIKTAKFPSNWELAAGRALTVVNTMIEGGLAKERISAATFADSRPISDNGTAEGRKHNRRIEIVVVPDLSQMPGFDELNKLSQQQNSGS